MKFLFLIFFLIGPSPFLYAKDSNAKITWLRGQAYFQKDVNDNKHPLKVGDELEEKSIVSTGAKSLLKIEFLDGSIINLSPESNLSLNQLDKKNPSLVQLVSGKLRAQVKKSAEREYGLFIKTNSASIGVRGTDFEVIYNSENKITSALTFTGEVALINSKGTEHFDDLKVTQEYDDAYVEVLSGELQTEKTKFIKAGEFSGSFPGYKEPLVPVKIARTQFEFLKQNNNTENTSLATNDFDTLSLKSSATEKHVKPTNDSLVPKPRSFYTAENYPTETLTTPGGYLDQKTGIYIAPPADAPYDEKNGVYLIPEEYGNVDKNTGDYIPPLGLILHPLKGFIFLEDQFNKVSAKTKDLVLKLNGQLKQGMAKLKELTRLDASLLPSLYYDSNVTNEFYGRVDKITNKPSYVLRFDGFLAHKTLDTKNWLIYPKGSLTTLYHYNQEVRSINTQDSIDWTGGLELNHRYLISHRPGRQIFEVNYHITMRDQEGADKYSYDTEDIFVIFGQEFKLHAQHTTKIWAKFTYYETYLSKLGTIWSGHLIHSIDMGRKHDLQLGSSISRERPHGLRTLFLWDGFISHKRKNLWDHYFFTSTFKMRYSDLHLIYRERGQEKLFAPEIRLTRIIDDYLNFSAFYSYEQNVSGDSQNYHYVRSLIGLDMNFIF